MKLLRKWFLNGVITTVPIVIVIWVIIQLFNFFDNFLGNYLTAIDHHYIPGMGLLLTVVLITLAGALATHWVSSTFFAYLDALLKRVPFVKSLYVIVKDTVESFVGHRKAFRSVVLVRMGDSDIEMMGFLTNPEGISEFAADRTGKVTVFVPMSFQMTGMTLLVPEEEVTVLDMSVEEGLKFTLSAGISHDRGNGGPSPNPFALFQRLTDLNHGKHR